MNTVFLAVQLLLSTIVFCAMIIKDGSLWWTLLFMVICFGSLRWAFINRAENSDEALTALSVRPFLERCLPLLLIGLGIGLRFYSLGANSIWLDEDSQVNFVNRPFDIVTAAALQQQPPIDYFFTWASIQSFGHVPWAARLPAAFFGSAFLCAFYFLLFRLTRSSVWSALGLSLAVVNPWLIRYSQEGRPLACSLFYLTVFLFYTFELFERKSSRPAWINLIFVNFFYLASVGFQPPLVILSLNLALVFTLYSGHATERLRFHFAAALALVLFLPFGLLIQARAMPFLKQPDWTGLVGYFSQFGLRYLGVTSALATLPFPLAPVARWLLPAVWLWGALSLFLKSSERSKSIFAALIFTSGLFILISTLTFELIIDYPNPPAPRYFLSSVPLLLLVFVLTFQRALRGLELVSPWLKRGAHGGVGLIVLLLFVYGVRNLQKVYVGVQGRESWPEIYKYLDEQSENDAAAFMFPVEVPMSWVQSGLLGAQFYFTGVMRQHVFAHDQWKIADVSPMKLIADYLQTGHEPKVFYMLNFRRAGPGPSAFEQLAEAHPELYQTKRFGSIDVLSFRNAQGARRSIVGFLEHFLRHLDVQLGASELSHGAYEALLYISLFERNCEQSRRYLELNSAAIDLGRKSRRAQPFKQDFNSTFRRICESSHQ